MASYLASVHAFVGWGLWPGLRAVRSLRTRWRPQVSSRGRSPNSNGGTYDFPSSMRPRMYGSTDIKRLRTTTSWSFGGCRVVFATTKLDAAGIPVGRETNRTSRPWKICILVEQAARRMSERSIRAFAASAGWLGNRGLVGSVKLEETTDPNRRRGQFAQDARGGFDDLDHWHTSCSCACPT